MAVSDVSLLASLSLLLAAAALSERLGLGQGRAMVVSALRAGVQLLLVGQILGTIFAIDSPFLVGGYLVWMVGAALWVAWSRLGPRKVFALKKLDVAWVLLGLGAATAGLTRAVNEVGVNGVRLPISSVIIPFVGIVLGNVLSSLGLAIERFQSEIKSSRALIEARLLAGASVWEAGSDSRRAALSAAMTPILNALSAAGIVSLPGALTGQLLSGQDPLSAVRVQLLILISLALASWLGCATLLYVLSSRWTDFEREAFFPEAFS